MKLRPLAIPALAAVAVVLGSTIILSSSAHASEVAPAPVATTTTSPALTSPTVPAQGVCDYSATWLGNGGSVVAKGPGSTCSNPLDLALTLWQFRGPDKFPQDQVTTAPLTIDKPGTYVQSLPLGLCQQIDWYGSTRGPVVVPAVLEGGNEPRFIHDLVPTQGAPAYAFTSHTAADCTPTTPAPTPTEEPSSTPSPSSPAANPSSTPSAPSTAPVTPSTSASPTPSSPVASPSSTATQPASGSPAPSQTSSTSAAAWPGHSDKQRSSSSLSAAPSPSATDLAYTGTNPLPGLIVGVMLLSLGLGAIAYWALAPRLKARK